MYLLAKLANTDYGLLYRNAVELLCVTDLGFGRDSLWPVVQNSCEGIEENLTLPLYLSDYLKSQMKLDLNAKESKFYIKLLRDKIISINYLPSFLPTYLST
jgi:hypothetical protein